MPGIAGVITSVIGGIQQRNAVQDAARALQQGAQGAGDTFGAGVTDNLGIIGEGYDRPRLEEAIRKASLGFCIKLFGHSDDVRAELRQADLFILPSLYEGMPNTLVEALDEGLRVVVTPCRGAVSSLMVRLGASAMVVPEIDFANGLVRAIEASLSLEAAAWAEIHVRHREVFDNERNFQKLRQLLAL
jgi:glycosyltransferase involved in cell wall biosynthesis